MCVIVNLDLVIPAILKNEVDIVKEYRKYGENKRWHLENIQISPNYAMNYANSLKYLDLGRVVVNFRKEDVEKYFKLNSQIFKEILNENIYKLILPMSDEVDDIEKHFDNLINEMVSKLNYSNHVLEVVGLL